MAAQLEGLQLDVSPRPPVAASICRSRGNLNKRHRLGGPSISSALWPGNLGTTRRTRIILHPRKTLSWSTHTRHVFCKRLIRLSILAFGRVNSNRASDENHQVLKGMTGVLLDGTKERFADGHIHHDVKQGMAHDQGSAYGSKQATMPFQHAKVKQPSYLFRSFLENILPSQMRGHTTTLELAPASPLPPFTGRLTLAFAAVLVAGVFFEKWWWNLRQDAQGSTFNIPQGKKQPFRVSSSRDRPQAQNRRQAGFSDSGTALLQKDLGKKETVEWVNMVLGKVWKVYRRSLEGWLVGLVQPLIDNLKKPEWVKRVEIKQFYLGDEPLSVRTVERRTSRRVNDLQYHIGLRYTGGARLLLLVYLKFGVLPVTVPVAVRRLDLDGELWVKLRLVPQEPFVGAATWAFVSLPKIKLAMAPFRLLNVMAIPLLSIFLEKLLTQDLPQLFVRPNKNVLDFMQGRSVGPLPKDIKDGDVLQGNKDFSGELSVTLINARKLTYFPIGKTDPYVVLILGEQVIRSKRNSETSVFGPPGDPIWNQDFQFVVVDPKSQLLAVRVRDTFGLGVFTVGYGEVNLGTLQDTVPTEKVVSLHSTFPKRFGGEVVMRLTYRAYVEDEEEDGTEDRPFFFSHSYGKMPDVVEEIAELARFWTEEARKAQELFLQTSFPGGADRNDDKTPRYMGKMPPVIPMGLDSSNDNTSKEIDLLKLVYGGAIGSDSDDYKASSFGSQLQRLGENPVLLWLGVTAGIAVLVAINLNFSNLFNP